MEVFTPIANLGPAWVFIINLAVAVLGGIAITTGLTKLLKRCLVKSERVDNAVITFIVNAVKVACIIVVATIVLQMLGVNMSTIIAVLGAAGAAIALALRDSLANIAGGFMIIVTHPFSEGDLISVNQDRGRVERIDLFQTTLRTLDYRTVTIPNGIINTSVVYNESNQELRRADCTFTISYESDVERAKAAIYDVCRRSSLISMEREPAIGVSRHLDSGIELECLAYCREGDQWNARYYLNEEVLKEFRRAGIEIPYPHVQVKTD
ncbi:MAG: mechanosensitive ion channel family protein [Lentihominibacter sp.]|nr:mechanosensitive ion channel family protein [Clostridiales bacterium]MDD6978795.1 mechanosensitive ion channel family protein [Bacillota bacterium]MDY6173744.1 mechanosensitive ion channel family protein [Lentihominibacter sp.]